MPADKLHALLRWCGYREEYETPLIQVKDNLWMSPDKSQLGPFKLTLDWLLLDPDGPGAKLRAAGWMTMIEIAPTRPTLAYRCYMRHLMQDRVVEAVGHTLDAAIIDAFHEAMS